MIFEKKIKDMGLADQISEWIKTRVKEAGAKGVVVGLSGGIDSSVVAALLKKALGDSVLGLIMPCKSSPEDEEYASLIASHYNLRTEIVSLDVIYDKFLDILPPADIITQSNLKPRLRMITLYYFANKLNYLVAGTGNKSEIMVGYFTKYGDGAVDILPLGGLLKTQVRELALELGIPKEILNRVPSAGLWKNQTDEGELGISYEDLDRIILGLKTGETANLPADMVEKVKKLIKASEHKRISIPVFNPNYDIKN
jgi:NAD+ synthase